MAEYRGELVADQGGEETITAAKRALVELAVAARFKRLAVEAYLLSMDSLVDRRHRCVWPVVKDAAALEAHERAILRDLGLERRAKAVPSLAEYLAAKAAATPPAPATPTAPTETP
jgi:hypothetical protein